jgi:hypothetical protein
MSGFEPPPPPPPSCSIHGDDVWFASVVSSAESGGVTLARLGGFADWELIELSGDSESGRAKVRWSSGKPGLALEGWVDARDLAFRARHDVALVPGHVWINTEANLTVRVEGANALIAPSNTPFANIRATVSCADLQLGSGDEPFVPAKSYFAPTSKTLSLYSAPKGTLLTTLVYASSFDEIAYAALEEKGGFLRLVDEGDVRLDAWVKASEMKPWLGELPHAPFVCGLGNLEIEPKNTVVRTITEDTEVLLDPSPTSMHVGVISRGTRVRVAASKKSFVSIDEEVGRWGPAQGKKLWVKSAAVGP